MATSQLSLVIQDLRRFVFLRDAVGMTDEQLLESFVRRRDEVAFEVLVRRHGAMVMGVCRRVLRSHHDAEDAFQATFLVLARKASLISPRGTLGNWLYRVAFNAALKAKASLVKRRGREREGANMPEPEAAAPGQWDDLHAALDEELSRLPGKYRIPIVLCDLEGKTRKEAAAQLGWREGTVASRLARARAKLAKSLVQRGVALSAGARAGEVSLNIASASVSSPLVASTSAAAILYVAGQSITSVVSTQVAALAHGVLKAMILTKIKLMTVTVLALGMAALGGASLVNRPTMAGPLGHKPGAVIAENRSDTPEQVANPAEKNQTKPVVADLPDPNELEGLGELTALRERWYEQLAQYYDAVEKKLSDEKIDELRKQLLPAKGVDEHFELEKKYRGKNVGLFSLNAIIETAGMVGDPDLAVDRGRERALDVLREHYLHHSDLHVVLASIYGDMIVFGYEALLEAAAEKSRRQHNRAAALFHHAEHLVYKARTKVYCEEQQKQQVKRASSSDPSHEWTRKALLQLADFDVTAARKKAEILAKRVMAEYPDTAPTYGIIVDGKQIPSRNEAESRKYRPYAVKADGLLFELTQLFEGAAAPALVATDVDGKEFRLRDCRGQVVVLIFSKNGNEFNEKLYPALRVMQKTFEGKPFTIVAVMADRELATVQAARTKGEITWRTIWDGEGQYAGFGAGPIASKWNILSFPAAYVFDQHSNLHYTNVLDPRDVEATVAGLLWDRAGHTRDGKTRTLRHSPETQQALWGRIAGPDVPGARRAIWEFVADPSGSVPFLAERLSPAPAPDVKAITAWIGDLESAVFAKRDQAAVSLAKIGEAALPSLRAALKNGPPLEQSRRLERLVEELVRDDINLAGERRRNVYAVETLQAIGGPAARKVLEHLATGFEVARLTKEAQSALRRMPLDQRTNETETK